MSGALPDGRPRMKLLEWRAIGKGALIGRANIELPSGLQIADCGVFIKERARWAQMPAEPMRDAGGQPLKDDQGKTRYRSPVKWRSHDLQSRWSHALIELIEAEHGPLDESHDRQVEGQPQQRQRAPRRRPYPRAGAPPSDQAVDPRPFDDRLDDVFGGEP